MRLSSRPVALSQLMLRTLVSGAAVLALVLTGLPAVGQSISAIQAENVNWSDGQARDANELNTITGRDCADDLSLEFSLQLGGGSNDLFEVWAGRGADCTDADERTGDSPTCWKVAELQSQQPRVTVNVPVRNIAAADPRGTTELVEGTEQSCRSSAEDTITLYFWYRLDTRIVEGHRTYAVQLNMNGPQPPDVTSARAADQGIFVEWSNISTTTRELYLYCARGVATETESGGTPAATESPDSVENDSGVDAGGAFGGGMDSGAPSTPNQQACSSPLVPGAALSQDPRVFRCGGEFSSITTKGLATGLDNNRLYAVAIVAVDAFENTGAVSEVLCATPQNATNFIEAYEQLGGKGGGLCKIGHLGQSGGGEAWLLALVGWVLLAGRRRRRKCDPASASSEQAS